jgi:hypothetical protein
MHYFYSGDHDQKLVASVCFLRTAFLPTAYCFLPSAFCFLLLHW